MELSDLAMDERETHISQCAADRSKWEVFTEDVVMMRKLDEIAEDITDTKPPTLGKYYRLDGNQVRLFKPYEPSEKQIAAQRKAAERLRDEA